MANPFQSVLFLRLYIYIVLDRSEGAFWMEACAPVAFAYRA